MKYLFSCDFSDFEPQEISATKMKSDIMRDQLFTPIRFIINYISSWCEDKVAKPSCTSLYQKYLEWCGENGEKPFNSTILGKKFLLIGINQTHSRDNGVRVYQYILDCSKIIAKLHESGLDDIKEFFDTPQPNLSKNEIADISIFNVSEIISPKIILTLSEKNMSPSNISKDKKVNKKSDLIQDFFNYMTE